MRTLNIHSLIKFQVYNRILLPIVTILYIRISELIPSMDKRLIPVREFQPAVPEELP